MSAADELRAPLDPCRFAIEAADVDRYARAIGADASRYGTGTGRVPPGYSIRWMWPLMTSAGGRVFRIAPFESVVHVSHHVRFHQMPVVGTSLVSTGEIVGLRPLGSDALLIIDIATAGDDGQPISSATTSIMVRGKSLPVPVIGDRRLPARHRRIDGASTCIEELLPDQVAERYADAAGDRNPIHLDEGAARRAGLEGRVLHGMCVLAIGLRSVIDLRAGGDDDRLAEVSARFERPAPLRAALRTEVGPAVAGDGLSEVAFTCASDATVSMRASARLRP